MEILPECDRRTNHTTQIEDCPEYADESSLLSLSWICHHQRALCGPQQGSTSSEDSASSDDEIICAGVDIHSPNGQLSTTAVKL